jgi:hypothetical protein
MTKEDTGQNNNKGLKKAEGRRQRAEGAILRGYACGTLTRTDPNRLQTPCRRWGFIPEWH